MNERTWKMAFRLTAVALMACTSFSCAAHTTNKAQTFSVRIADKPLTFCNPLNIVVGSERVRRMGEPVVVLYKDDYYLFAGGSGYWYSGNFRDWAYVNAPTFPRGIPSVATDGKTMYACVMNAKGVFASTDPKQGVWTQVGTMDSDRYGDADMFIDDDGRVYMYWGWSQLMPFRGVELDPNNGFKEKGQSVTFFFGDYEAHGFERRRSADVIFPYFTHRPYFPEEFPWIEGPWMIKHNGKYYLQYAAIGLEFSSYSHGVYVSDHPLGPFVYSPHNPLTFKTTGYALGAGHGSTFHDKNGDLWTICMIPSYYGGRGGSEIVLFPTAVDADGVMHSNTAFGDYPQYYPGVKEDAVKNNFAGWMLLSHKKRVETSSTLEGFGAANAVDENFMTHWSAATGNAGEYMTVDLGKECDVYAVQVNFDQQREPNAPGARGGRGGMGFGGGMGMGMRGGAAGAAARYQSYRVEVSADKANWSPLIDKSNNTQDLRHDYTELEKPAKARFIKVTNVFTPEGDKFAIQELRVFGNPAEAKFTKVKNVMVARDLEDPRDATITWQPVAGADGYVVRYGIEPDKLYNNYMVYDKYSITIHSLNRDEKYFFDVEAFDSGTDYYRERTEQTMGRGAEIELSRGAGAGMRGGGSSERKMTHEGVNEYVFDNITPGTYTLRHTFGPVLWRGDLTEAQLIGSGDQPTVTATLSDLGRGVNVLGKMELKVMPGEKSGKIVVVFNYSK